MLSAPLNLGKVDATILYDFLYSLFHRDFVSDKTFLNGNIWIDPRSHRLEDGKEATFWHLTTREQERHVREGNRVVIKKDRLFDPRRSERIEWVKQIILNNNDASVKCFYHRESNKKQDIRLYLWAHTQDFVVILQKLGRSSSFLVTSFYVDKQHKRDDYQSRFQRYQTGCALELKDCEWF